MEVTIKLDTGLKVSIDIPKDISLDRYNEGIVAIRTIFNGIATRMFQEEEGQVET